MSRDLVAAAQALFDAVALLVRAGVSGPDVEDIARRGSSFLARDLAERDGEAERKRSTRRARVVSADTVSPSLSSLLDQDQEREEGEPERGSGVRLVAAKLSEASSEGATTQPTSSQGSIDVGASGTPGKVATGPLSLDAAPTPPQEAATARVGLRDPRGAWLAFLANRRAKKRDPHDLAAWVTWATRAKRFEDIDAARAPPVDPRQQSFDDWRARDKLQAEERRKLAREAVPAPAEWRAAVARIGKLPAPENERKTG